MIHESYPWKNDLKKWNEKLKKCIDKFDDRAYITVEKSIFSSAFIMRKLFDCKTKITTKVSQKTKIRTERYIVGSEEINLLRRYIKDETLNNTRSSLEHRPLRFICNKLIHSTAFEICQDSQKLVGFFVSSDDEEDKKNNRKPIYYIKIEDWISSVETVADDQITYLCMTFNEKAGDYDVYAR